MPVWYSPAGTAIAARTETAALSGTATVTATPSPVVPGTATADRTSLMAWVAQSRRTATRVLMGPEGEDMVRIQGDVAVNQDAESPVATASFQLTDPRCAYFASGSIATGGVPVTIRCRLATDIARADTAVFRGLTEAAPNTGANVPVATIQCAGEGQDWLEEKGCLELNAFPNVTRLEALKAFAESVGIDPDRITGGEGSAKVLLPLSLSGLSTWTLMKRFAYLEDWYWRCVDGGIELLPARQVVGPDAVPVFDFIPGNYESVAETPPNRPVTRWNLSAVGIPEEILTGGVEETTPTIETTRDETGAIVSEIRTLTTTVNGVLVWQRIEEWRNAAIPGVTPSDVAWRLWQLTETSSTYLTVTIDGVVLRTARVDAQSTTVQGWYSAPCRTADGFVWSDGTRHVANVATWQTISTAVTAYTYDVAPSCILLSTVKRSGGWYSPLVASGEDYDDGSIRADAAYQWVAETEPQPFELVEELNSEESTAALSVVSTSSFTWKMRVPPGSAAQVDEWALLGGSRSRWSTVPGSGLVMLAIYILAEDGTSVEKSAPYGSALPVLPRAAADIPQYRTVPLSLIADADGARFAASPMAEPVWGAQSMDDLVIVGRRYCRDGHSPTVTILSRANPFLKIHDVVRVQDPTRNLDFKVGFIRSIRPTYNASTTGGLKQETVVVFPLPAYDPGAQVVSV